jgi:hypothetical protein
MTQLSLKAQAVLDAFAKSCDGEYIDGEWQQDDVGKLATALRAVADLPNELEIPFNVITDWEAIPGSCAKFHAAATWGYNQALETQRTIANELDTYRD